MGHRLSRIVTRTGDDGTTRLGDGARVAKDSSRIAALGDLDELNSAMGCVLAEDIPQAVKAALLAAQNDLFDLGGEISIPGRIAMTEAHVERLDASVERLNTGLAPLREFILPGGSRAGAMCHLARTICRRAERSVVALAREQVQNPASRQYLNRLSDLLFVSARIINQEHARPEASWRPGAALKSP